MNAPKVTHPLYAKRRPTRRGAVTVEMALLISVAFMLFMAAIEMARVQLLVHAAANAAYEAARVGIVPGADATIVRSTATSYLNIYRASSPVITVTPGAIDDTTEEVRVDVSIPLNGNSWVIPRFGAGRSVTGTATLRAERFRTS